MSLTASVECGKYFKADCGTLTLADGQLRFETDGGCLFDVSLSSIQKIVWHWYSFSAAFEATITGKKYFLSFIPRGAGLDAWYHGLRTGRRWRAAMEGQSGPDRTPVAALAVLVLARLGRIFVLGCVALLSLGVAVDPAASTLMRTLGGTGAVAAGLGAVALIGQGMIAVAARMRRKREDLRAFHSIYRP